MKILVGSLKHLNPLSEPVAVTMGNFDGLHRGHKALIAQLQAEASQRGLKAAVLSFAPHPNHVFQSKEFKPLQTLAWRHQCLKELGLDFHVVQDFNETFSEVEPEDFLRQYLLPFFNPSYILFGYDFRFGNKGRGTYELAHKLLADSSVELAQAPCFRLEGESVSSTLIRDHLRNSRIVQANQLLGYPYRIIGKVGEGQKLGRQLGFPTANLIDVEVLVPQPGVYAGKAIFNNQTYSAVLNIGVRPTVSSEKNIHLECHILDFGQMIYGQQVEFHFYDKIRNEMKFDGVDALKNQIAKDVAAAKSLLGD